MTQPSRRIAMTRNTPSSGTTPPDGSMIAGRTLALVLDLKRPGNQRRVSTSQIEVDAERELIRVSKQLLNAPSLLAIEYCDSRVRKYINSVCLPSLLRGGVFLLPLGLVEEVDRRLQGFQTERETLVEAFLAEYPELVTAAQSRLRGLFDADDYPHPSALRPVFGFSWKYLAFEVPGTLAAIDRIIFQREREKAAAQWQVAAETIQNLLRTHMAELVGKMSERLTPGPDGKPKVFRNTAVSNLSEFLRNFDARNVTDDDQLSAIVARARQLLEGVDPDTLRSSQDIRETVRAGFSGLQRNLDAMVTNRPARRIVLNREQQLTTAQAENVQQIGAVAGAPTTHTAIMEREGIPQEDWPTSAEIFLEEQARAS